MGEVGWNALTTAGASLSGLLVVPNVVGWRALQPLAAGQLRTHPAFPSHSECCGVACQLVPLYCDWIRAWALTACRIRFSLLTLLSKLRLAKSFAGSLAVKKDKARRQAQKHKHGAVMGSGVIGHAGRLNVFGAR